MQRAFQFIIFITIFSAFLYIANLVVYEALVVIFNLSAVQSVELGVLLGVLSTSFIAATIVGNWYYNIFTRVYYTLAAVWIGCFVYLFFASVIYGLSVTFTGQINSYAGATLIIAALLVSVYGVVNAKKITIQKVSVLLPNLPVAWQDRTAVWVSDLHLGQLHGPKFAQKVVEKIKTLSPSIMFIGGDLYDGTGAPDVSELIEPFKNLSAPLGIYFITGNHEEFGDNKRFTTAITSAGIHVLDDELVELDGLQLVGVDYYNANDTQRFADILSKLTLDRAKPSILLKHEPRDLGIAHAAGISLQISGHTHRAQMWPLEYIARLVYKAHVYGLKPFKNMQVYVSSGTGTWGPPLRVGTNSEIVVFTFN